MLLMKMLPMIPLCLRLFKLSLSMLLTMKNKMFIIEWDMIMLFSSNIKLDIMLERSNFMYSSTIMFISSMVMKFSKEYMSNDPNKFRFTYIILMFIMSMDMLVFIPTLMYMYMYINWMSWISNYLIHFINML